MISIRQFSIPLTTFPGVERKLSFPTFLAFVAGARRGEGRSIHAKASAAREGRWGGVGGGGGIFRLVLHLFIGPINLLIPWSQKSIFKGALS